MREQIRTSNSVGYIIFREAKEVVSGESDYLGWPRKVFILEIGERES